MSPEYSGSGGLLICAINASRRASLSVVMVCSSVRQQSQRLLVQIKKPLLGRQLSAAEVDRVGVGEGAGSGYSSNKCPSPHCSSHVRYTPKSGQTQRRSVVRKVPFATKRLGLRLRGAVAKVQLGKRRNGSSSAPLSAAGGVFVLIF